MFWSKSGCLAYNLTNFPRVPINFPDFFHNISNMTWTAPSFNCKYPLMCVHTSHQPYGYPPLYCVHGNKHIRTHDVVCDTFVAIVRGVGFHMGREQLHVFSLNIFNSSHWQVSIVVTKGDICTLVDVVVNPKWMIYSLDLAPPKNLLLLMWLKPKNGIIVIDTISINSSP